MRMLDLPEGMAAQFVVVDTRPTGLGEIGNPLIGGAVSNAFYGLTGKWLRHLPVTPERVLDTSKPETRHPRCTSPERRVGHEAPADGLRLRAIHRL
jgi:hypothetical protein